MKTVAIVPAAGIGKRLKIREKKPFVALRGKPLIAYTLKALDSSRYIDEIIIAVEAPSIGRLKQVIARYGFKKVVKVVAGGKTRNESVRNCFDAIDAYCGIVLIHDGARPFPEESVIKNSVISAKRFGACVAAIPMTDTVKLAGKSLFVRKTLDRASLWRAQTPQAFRYNLLKDVLNRINRNSDITDEASIFECLGKRVKIVKGSVRNIKITTKDDLKIAEGLL